MDTTPIYELRERLRAAAMAGTNLLSEDFRLKRAQEAFKPLEAASPVFAKVGELTEKLLSPDCQNTQGALLDAITLADAVICTLGTVEAAGAIESVESVNAEENAGSVIVNAPYSTLKELLDALTTSGGGHYGYICEARESKPELFRDYRVKHTLVQALGASYAELADKVEQWMIEDNDKTILPALYKDFDPKGKKEMVRRVNVIGALAGAKANDFYVKMLDGAQKDVRTALIDALHYEPRNVSLLFDLSKTEKGKNKDKVFELLAEIQDEQVNDFFKELAKKKPDTVLNYLKNTTTDWSAELVADICNELLEKIETIDAASDEEKQKISRRLRDMIRAVFGKGGTQICECYRKLIAQKEKINQLLKETWQQPKNTQERDILQYGVLTSGRFWYKAEKLDIETALGKILHHSLIANPDSDLQALALELYQNENSGKTNVKFLAAAATVQFSGNEDCTAWLEEQVTEKVLLVSKLSKERMKAVTEAALYIRWDSKKNRYKLNAPYIADYYAIGNDYTDFNRVERLIELPQAKEIMKWFQKHEASQEIDKVLSQWVPLNDKALCREMGEYFYNRALVISNNRFHIDYMHMCGWTVCKVCILYTSTSQRDKRQC
ncbi:MAG: hypothetical protein K2M91_05220, partial [Lachnospiraceae bacterium]|nr:hypothetical protein [Lachnospiraceae bacterium]